MYWLETLLTNRIDCNYFDRSMWGDFCVKSPSFQVHLDGVFGAIKSDGNLLMVVMMFDSAH